MDFDEEDGPPELVEADDGLEEEETVKVPITIVTGTHLSSCTRWTLAEIRKLRTHHTTL